MNLLLFSMFLLLQPLASIANTPVIVSKKVTPTLKQAHPHRGPSSSVGLIDLKPAISSSSLLQIVPKIPIQEPPKPKGPTYLKLSKVQSKDQLVLSFESYDPHLKLDTKAPLAIQFFPDYPLQLSHSLIMGSIWPKDGTPLVLTYSNATPKTQNKLIGKASYTYCHNVTHKCNAVFDPLLFYFIPD